MSLFTRNQTSITPLSTSSKYRFISSTSLGITTWLCLLVGCASPSQISSFATLQMASPDRDATLQATSAVLNQLGYTIEQAGARSAIRGVRRVSKNDVAKEVGLSRTQVDSDQYRLLADIRVFESVDACKLYCRISLQQQTTEAYRLFASNYTSSDLPTATPIDREAATTADQNTVWSTIRRIRGAERELMQAVNHRLNNPKP